MVIKYLKVGLYNAGSLGTNHDNIIASVTRSGVDVLAVNETWVHEGEEGRAPTIPGYKFRHTPRPRVHRSRGGGVGFYIKRGITVRAWRHPVDPLHSVVEQMWLTLNLDGRKLVIGTAYRPNWVNIDVFFDAITDSVSSIPKFDNLILLGDFNTNYFDINDYRTKKFISFLSCFNLEQLVTEPTHFTDTSQTLIDVVCSDLRAKKITSELVGTINGHCLVVCEFNTKRVKIAPRTVSYRPINNICMDNFNSDLQSIRWELISQYKDINEMTNAFNYGVLYLFDFHAPVKTIVMKDRSYPWITDTIKLMMRLRDDAAADYNKTKSETKKIYYKNLKSTVNCAIYHEKSAYYKHNINNNISKPKLLWKNLKNTLLPKKDNDLPTFFNDPNVINNHFLTIQESPLITISHLTFFEYHKFSNAVFHIEQVSPNQLIKIIKNLKSNAEGCDAITLSMLLLTFPQTIDCIGALINTSIATCKFPDMWKLGIVRPLPKNSNPTVLKDLRPISILPCLSKILEKAICLQLTDYLEYNNILPTIQSGFRKGRSTTSALLDVTDNILSAQDKGLCTILVLLDFSRAFDSLNIDLLMSKLNYYGVDSKALQWFNSYLSDRYQYVKITQSDGSCVVSDKVAVTRGVPQGSILGPILFSLYSADIVTHITHSKCHIYADDTQIYISCKPQEVDEAIRKLNFDLERIAAWSSSNSLFLNPVKTKYLIFGSRHQLASICPSVSVMLMGEPIERVHEARNLGLIMDSELRYEKHVGKCVRDCFYRLKVLYKLRPFLVERLRVELTESLILSKLNYMDAVVGPRLKAKSKNLIQRVQNACARFCFNIPSRAHVTPFLNKHGLLKMLHRRKFHLACLLFGILKYREPSYLYDKLSWKWSNRPGVSRACSTQLTTERHASAAFRGSFRYAASKCWNNIPPPIRNLQSLYTFRVQLKRFIYHHQKSEEPLVHDTSAI